MVTQLTLDLQLRESYTFENFVVGDNALLVQLLQQMLTQAGEQQVFLWGEQFTGKSHLLQAVCQSAAEKNQGISYLPFKQIIEYTPDVLEGLEQIDLVCIDDVQLVSYKPEWQEKVFDLINRMRETGKRILFSAHMPPNELELQLEDLRSRLNWGPVLKICPLNDSQKQQALQLRAKLRGFELPDKVASFMLKNYARDLPGLFEKLETLDKASLQLQRKLTVPFVKTVFDL